jgi:hypothetical protein
MIIRDLQPSDLGHVAEIHAKMGMDYALPDLQSPLCLVQKVATDDDGKILGISVLRLEAECYLLLDPELTARSKVDTMLNLQPEVLRSGWEKGLENVVAWIPEDVERRFQRRLKQLGWSRDRTEWHSWSRPLEESSL